MTRRSRLVFAAAALFAAAVPSFPLALAAAPQGCVLLEDLLQAAPGQAYAGLGRSLAVHGSTAVAGATHLDVVGSDSGGAYVFVEGPPGVWSQEAELLAPQPAQQDYFGISVAVHGDTIAVGSLTDGGPGYQSGAVLLFERTGGTWSFVQQLVGSGVQAGDWFGESVALDGDRLAVGCTRENHANGYGLTYVFRRAGSAWVEEARLVPDLFPAAYAGQAVALQGDRLVVGNPLANSVTHTGFAYVYERDGAGAWNRVAVLAASDGRPGDGFGRSVALDGDNVLVGARQANPGGLRRSGAVYLFERGATGWSQAARWVPTDSHRLAFFGSSLALAGDRAVVGAQGSPFIVPRQKGAAYLWERSGGAWRQLARLDEPGAANEFLTMGASVALLAGRAFVSVPGEGAGGFAGAGTVRVHSWPAAPATTYCTAKPASGGCLPAIAAYGRASFTDPSPFEVAASVVPDRPGLLLYGTSGRAALPFQGGVLCAAPPLRRTPPSDSGSAGAPPCAGTLAFDFNAWLRSGADPDLTPGATLQAQWWFRDGGVPSGSGLTDAVEFTPCP